MAKYGTKDLSLDFNEKKFEEESDKMSSNFGKEMMDGFVQEMVNPTKVLKEDLELFIKAIEIYASQKKKFTPKDLMTGAKSKIGEGYWENIRNRE